MSNSVYRKLTTEELWSALEASLRRLELDHEAGQGWRSRGQQLREARAIAAEIKLRGVQLQMAV